MPSTAGEHASRTLALFAGVGLELCTELRSFVKGVTLRHGRCAALQVVADAQRLGLRSFCRVVGDRFTSG